MTKKRRYKGTKVSLAPLTVDEVLGALLKTPPPPKEPKAATKKAAGKKR